MPVWIFGMLLIILVFLIYGLIVRSDFFGDSPTKGLCFLVGASFLVLLFIAVFPGLMDPAQEEARFEVVEASLGHSSYYISYRGEGGRVKVAKTRTVVETDEPSYLAYCQFRKGFLKEYGYVYFLNSHEVNQ